MDLPDRGLENLDNPEVEVGFSQVADKNFDQELKKLFRRRRAVEQVTVDDVFQIFRTQRVDDDTFDSFDELWLVRQEGLRQGFAFLLFAFDAESGTFRRTTVAAAAVVGSGDGLPTQKFGDVWSLQDVVKGQIVAKENSQRRLSWKEAGFEPVQLSTWKPGLTTKNKEIDIAHNCYKFTFKTNLTLEIEKVKTDIIKEYFTIASCASYPVGLLHFSR